MICAITPEYYAGKDICPGISGFSDVNTCEIRCQRSTVHIGAITITEVSESDIEVINPLADASYLPSLVCTSKKLDAKMFFEAMVLSDKTIREEIAGGRIIIEPLAPDCVQPASVDLHLDKKLLVFKAQRYPAYIDVKKNMDHLNEVVELEEDKAFFLNPGEFVLASTLESITLPDDIVGRLEGKSSLGRIGLLIHSTAGYVDPGWQGNLTLELSNVAKLPITLYYKMKIGQISFLRLTSPVDRLYGAAELGSKYQGQTEPTASKYHENFVKGT